MQPNASIECQTNSHLLYIVGSLGAVSMATCFIALCWLCRLKLHRPFLYRLAAYQVMASLSHGLFYTCQLTFLNYDSSKYSSCVAVSFLIQVANWTKACFGCWITFHLFCFAVLLKNMKKLEPLYVTSSILIAITLSSVPLITNSYGPTGEWCWIQGKICGKVYETGVIEQFALWYGPVFVALLLQSIAMLWMVITVYCRAHKKPEENVYGRDQYRQVFRQLLPLVAYPLLFMVFIVPPLINRVYGIDGLTTSTVLTILSGICIPFWSLSAGVTLTVHIAVVRRAELIALICRPFVYWHVLLTNGRGEYSSEARDLETLPVITRSK